MKKYLLKLFICLSTLYSNAQNYPQIEKIVASDRAIGDNFGYGVSVSGDYAIIGAPFEDHDENGNNPILNAGSAYIFEKDGSGNWVQKQKLVSSDRSIDDLFGTRVSISGNYALVGTMYDDEDSLGGNIMSNSGSAYIFERDISGTWVEKQKIVASDRSPEDAFACEISLAGDYIIIGAYYDDDDTLNGIPMSDAGSAYIFEKNGQGKWVEVQKIVASDRDTNDLFGYQVAISGNYAIIGAYLEGEDETGMNSMINAGSAYIFERDINGIWNEVRKIVASDRDPYDYFGASISLSGDYALITASYDDENAVGGNTLADAGAAYIFERDGSGNWVELQKIVPSDRAVNDRFGFSGSISGNYLVVSSPFEDEDASGSNTVNLSGSAYIFEKGFSGSWTEIQKVVASDRGINDYFGVCSISGNTIFVGVANEDENASGNSSMNGSGSAYIFERTFTSVSDEEFLMYSIQPNPNNGVFRLFGDNLSSKSYRVTDINGRFILSGQIIGNFACIDISNHSNGMYFITVENTTFKFIKK